MELKLFDSERKVMEVLWDHGDLSAKELADRLKELVGWSKTTTYTVSPALSATPWSAGRRCGNRRRTP